MASPIQAHRASTLITTAAVVAIVLACSEESTDNRSDTGAAGAGVSGAAGASSGLGGAQATGGRSNAGATGGEVQPGAAGDASNAAGGAQSGTGGSHTGGTGGYTDNTGGYTDNTGGHTDNTGGHTGSTGGHTGNTGGASGAAGSTGNEGGSPAATGGEAGSGQAGESATGGSNDGPLLERRPRLEQDCSVSEPLTKLGLKPWISGDLVSTSAGTFLLRAQATDQVVDQLVVSTLDASGTLGPDVVLNTERTELYGSPRLAVREDRLGALWANYEADGTRTFVFAETDDSGDTTHAASKLSAPTGRLDGPVLAASSSGYALLYAETTDDYSAYRLEFATLDSSGTPVGAAKTLHENATGVSAGSVLAVPGGYAVTFTTSDYTSDAGAAHYLVFTDDNGAPSGDAIQLGTLAGSASAFHSLLLRGSEIIVAYSQNGGTAGATSVTVHLARVDLDTQTVVADVAVQSPVTDEENVDPRLVAVGEDVGLIWSRGTVIYICAGCMPDNHLEFIAVDGEDFTPVSDRVVFENQEPRGGYVWPRLATSGSDILVTSTLEYHVDGEGAFAAIRCEARP